MAEYRVDRGYLDDFDATIPYGEHGEWLVEIRALIWCYRGQVRFFEIALWAIGDEHRYEVASIDCCDSSIHIHRLKRSAPTDRQADRRTIVALTANDHAIVDREYQVQLDWMDEQWPALLRSWDDI
ncbi:MULTISPECIES: hypothetical protein [Gordonia]|uniref:hypothetical protein n=1 Tax=Gordonia TaxID=2053 RepID=UPI00257BBF1A|nr:MULTISPECIES: hypothetical protein [Gordonia]